MYNKVKSVQCFAIRSAKKAAVLQASLKLVMDEAKA